jgi:hypothetical protein
LDDGPERAEATVKVPGLATEEAAAVEVIMPLDDVAMEEAAAAVEIVPLDDIAMEEAAAVELLVPVDLHFAIISPFSPPLRIASF